MQETKNESFGHPYYSERLKRKMKLLASSKAAIIEAPSGCGKTTAMRGYLRDIAQKDEDVYWFTAVDEEAPAVLYRRLCGEIGKIDKKTGERLLEIDFPNAFTIGEVCDVLRAVKCTRKTWFVIDDYQFLFAILPASFLNALIDNEREELHIVIITQMLGKDFQKNIFRLGIPYISAPDLQWNAEDIRCYFKLAGVKISEAEANEINSLTEGWIIAVHLQLCSYHETGGFSDKAILLLMEHLIWDKMTSQQQHFFMRLSVFESCTLKRLCRIMDCDTLPDYAADCLSIPFLRYIPETGLCVPHALLREMVCVKRREHGEEFDKKCLRKAGDVCRDEGQFAEAVFFYAQIKDYNRILSLELSNLICAEVGTGTFNDVALEIARNCSVETKSRYPHSMLCIAWSVCFLNTGEFKALMDELDGLLPDSGSLRAEWLLLSVYLHYPHLEQMLPIIKKAAAMFAGAVSSVILPEVPWAFYEYLQLSTFHIHVGAAVEEAVLLEKFISIYSSLTGGHGAGADVLFRAELAFFRCDTAQAEILAHKAVFLSESKLQKNIQIGAVRLLAVIALLKSDYAGWQLMINNIEQVVFGSMQNTSMFRTMLDIVYGSLMAQLREYEQIAGWLKNAGFMSRQLPAAIYTKAVELHAYYLMGKGEHAHLIGFLQTIPFEKCTPFPEHFYLFTIAVGYLSLGDKEQANTYIEHSARKALPDDMLHGFVGFSRLLNGLSDEMIRKKHPDLVIRFNDYKNRYFTGWFALYRAITQHELPVALTEREREIAGLAAEGLRNTEIAEKIYVSEHTVRAHLRSIYQKLDIDRRAKLAKALK